MTHQAETTSAPTWRAGAPTPREILLTNVHVVDVVTGSLRPGPVWIRDGIIHAIGTEAEPAATSGVAQQDMRGSYLMPGLFNMHTHLSLSLPGERGREMNSLTPQGMALYMADGARRTLQSGVTTVRCVAEADHADFDLRRAIQRGLAIGPTIFSAGQGLVCTGGHGHGDGSTLECDGADGFRRGVRTQIRAGADLIKVMISGGIAGEHEAIRTRQLTSDELRAVIDTAHDWDRKVTAHAGPADVIEEAVRLGLDCVEHGYQLTPELCALMAERGTAYVPTLLVTRCGSFFDELGVPAWMQERSLSAGPRHVEAYRAALEAGVTVMVGSDMPPFWSFEGTTAVVREIEYMVEFGLSEVDALRAATLVPAGWLGIDDSVGRLEPGMQADAVALDRSPLEEIAALRSIHWVMKSGEVVRDDREVMA